MKFLVPILIFLFVVFVWLRAIRNAQLGIHHVSSTLGTTRLVDLWTTNPTYYTFELSSNWVVTTNGIIHPVVRVTNYYWHVWRIFQK